MSVTVSLNQADGGVPRCVIEGVLDFTTASSALEKVSVFIPEHAALDIDLAGVTRANSAALALMIEWLATARRANSEVTFHHIPDGLRQLAVVCQVDGLI